MTLSALGVFLLLQASAASTVSIPTSSAVDIVRRLGRDLGFAVEERTYYFDLMLTQDGKPPVPGYVSLGFFGNGNLIQEFAISADTGQIVDPRTCQLFEFPDLVSFQRIQQAQSGVKPNSPCLNRPILEGAAE